MAGGLKRPTRADQICICVSLVNFLEQFMDTPFPKLLPQIQLNINIPQILVPVSCGYPLSRMTLPRSSLFVVENLKHRT